MAYNYLLFHSIAEIFSIVIAFGVFTIAWSSRKKIDNMYILFIGIAYLFIALLDVLHTLSYKGMNIFTDYSFYANQLWLAARFMESLTLLIGFIFLKINKKINPHLTFIIYTIISTVFILSVFYWKIFPVCFIANQGQTQFKIISEYIIIVILLVTGILYYLNRFSFDHRTIMLLILSIGFTVLSELSFTLYISNYDFVNMLGHLFKIISFYFIYRSIIITGINRPADLIYSRLNKEREKLKVALNKLQLSNKEMEQFTSVVAHDLKNPLSVVISSMRLLKMKYIDKLDEEGEEILNATEARALRMATMIDEILSYARLGKITRPFQKIGLNNIMNDVIDNLQVEIKNNNVNIMYTNLPKVMGDKSLLMSLFQNIIENAIKYRKDNISPVIRIESDIMKDNGDSRLISINDNGIGIDLSHKDKIFMLFGRIDSNEDKHKGYGIGLTYCKKIVELHGGEIWLDSTSGEGTTFYFTLPKIENEDIKKL